MTTFNELCKDAHDTAVKSGWWGEDGDSFSTTPCLFTSPMLHSLSLCGDEWDFPYVAYYDIKHTMIDSALTMVMSEVGEFLCAKKWSEAHGELADVLIRLFDLSGKLKLDLDGVLSTLVLHPHADADGFLDLWKAVKYGHLIVVEDGTDPNDIDYGDNERGVFATGSMKRGMTSFVSQCAMLEAGRKMRQYEDASKLEAMRNNYYLYLPCARILHKIGDLLVINTSDYVPEIFALEMLSTIAECVYASQKLPGGKTELYHTVLRKMEHNKTRPHRHGGRLF